MSKRPKPIVLSRSYVLGPITYFNVPIQVQELDGKRYMIVGTGEGFSNPILIPNRTGMVETRMEGHRLIIDDGHHRGPRHANP